MVNSLGVVSWARCAALLSKELAKMVPQDIVVSDSDFALTSGPITDVTSALDQARSLAAQPSYCSRHSRLQAHSLLLFCLQVATAGSCLKHMLSIAETS